MSSGDQTVAGFLRQLAQKLDGTGTEGGSTAPPERKEFLGLHAQNPYRRPPLAPAEPGVWDTRYCPSAIGRVVDTIDTHLCAADLRNNKWETLLFRALKTRWTFAASGVSYAWDLAAALEELLQKPGDTKLEDVRDLLEKASNTATGQLEYYTQETDHLTLEVRGYSGREEDQELADWVADKTVGTESLFGLSNSAVRASLQAHLVRKQAAVLTAARKTNATEQAERRKRNRRRGRGRKADKEDE